MRSLRDIKRLVHDAQVHSRPEMNQAVLDDLVRELAACRTDASIPGGRRVWSHLAGVAALAAIFLIVALVVINQSSDEPIRQPTRVAETPSAADMLTVGRLNAACRRGGLPEIERQCEEAAQRLDIRPERISVEQLIREMNGT